MMFIDAEDISGEKMYTDYKTCENESKYLSIINNFQKNIDRIFIFGAGILGGELQLILSSFFEVKGYIDNDESKQEHLYREKKVYSLYQYMKEFESGLIIIAVSDMYYKDIKEQLEKNNKIENIDFYNYSYFMNEVLPIIVFYRFNMIYVNLLQLSLTERCTLKCRKCAHACYNVSHEAEDFEIDDVKRTMDTCFSQIDRIGEFVLIGGEPFLYHDLADVIEYIGKKYRDRMGIFSITTNGTLIPSDKLMEQCKRYNILVRISNYSKAIPNLKKRYEELCAKLKLNGVSYILGDEEHEWIDYGFGSYDRGESCNLRAVFDKCKTPCREIRGSRLYYCVMARSVSDNLNLGIGQDDYLDLNDIRDRKELLDFQLGYLKKGYLDMCRYCRGNEAAMFPIPAAEQVIR